MLLHCRYLQGLGYACLILWKCNLGACTWSFFPTAKRAMYAASPASSAGSGETGDGSGAVPGLLMPLSSSMSSSPFGSVSAQKASTWVNPQDDVRSRVSGRSVRHDHLCAWDFGGYRVGRRVVRMTGPFVGPAAAITRIHVHIHMSNRVHLLAGLLRSVSQICVRSPCGNAPKSILGFQVPCAALLGSALISTPDSTPPIRRCSILPQEPYLRGSILPRLLPGHGPVRILEIRKVSQIVTPHIGANVASSRAWWLRRAR